MDDRQLLQIHGIGAVVCLGLLAVLWLTVLAPATGHRGADAEIERQVVKGRRSLQEMEGSVAQLRQELHTLQTELDEAPLNIEHMANTNRRLAALNGLAATSRLQVDQLSLGASSAADYYQVVPIHFVGRGEFSDAVAFLRQLNSDMGDIAVESFEIRGPDGGAAGSATLEADFAWYAARADDG